MPVFHKRRRRWQGAGMLILNDQQQLLLGRRRWGLDRGTWSVPGGGVSRRDAGPWETACRETREEFGQLDALKALYQTPDAQRVHVRIAIPGLFAFTTYVVRLTSPPPIDEWPHASCLRQEFHEVCWFPRKGLPWNTHWGVRYALWKLSL